MRFQDHKVMNSTKGKKVANQSPRDFVQATGSTPAVVLQQGATPPRKTVAIVIAGLLAGLLLGFMDLTIVSTAGPTIISDLGGLSVYAWVFSAFVIVQTVAIPIFGKLSDLYGRKRFYLLGLVIFMGGSILSGASQTIYELILFRAVQGIGFGAFFPATLAIAGDLFPPERRGRAQGLLFSVNGVAFAVAPAAGSYLTEALSWRWIFYINLPFGVVSFVLIFFALRESRSLQATPFSDWLGASALAGFLAFILSALFFGGSTFAWGSWEEVALFAAGGFLLLGFIAAERRAKEPVLPPRLFKIRTISVATTLNILRSMVLFGLIAYIPLYAQAVLVGSISDVRNVVYSLALPVTGGILLSGAVLPRFGFRRVTVLGALVLSSGMLALTTISSSSSLLELMEIAVPLGLGNGMMIPAVIVAFQNSVQRREIGIASGLAGFTLNLGAALGLAVLGALQVNTFSSKLSQLLAAAPAGSGTLLSNPNTVGQILASPSTLARFVASSPALASIIPRLREAFSQSVLFPVSIMLGISVVVIVVSLFLKASKQESSPSTG